MGKDTRDARESSPQPGRKLRGGKVTVVGRQDVRRREGKEREGRQPERRRGE